MDIGGRTLTVQGGGLLHLSPAEGDPSFAAFLVAAGRLPAPAAAALEARAGGDPRLLPSLVAAHLDIPDATVRGLLRSLYLDRLVAGLRAEEAAGAGTPPLSPVERDQGPTFPLVPLVLDALARLAADGDAGKVGSRADHEVQWLDSCHSEQAIDWSGLDPEGGRVSHFLMRDPMAAPRIAALVRARLARLSQAQRPAVDRRERWEPGNAAARTSLSPPRAPRLNLEPGRAPEPSLSPVTRRLPRFVAPLQDPLSELEAEVQRLESAGADAPELARAWCEVARAWQRQFGALSEAARAYREAAAAEPSNLAALEQASNLCSALGQSELARAYARSAASACSADERAARLGTLATLELRSGRVDDARQTWLEAQAAAPDSCEPARALGRLEERLGHAEAAAEHFTRASRAAHDPAEARALLERALSLAPDDEDRLQELSRRLVTDGQTRAAIERVREASVLAPPERRLGLLYDAAETAEAESMPELAAELLLSALAEHPEAEVLYEPLAEDLERAGQAALLACGLETIAAATPRFERARWLSAAAAAMSEDPAGAGVALELYARALTDDPGQAQALDALRSAAERGRNYAMLADALERAGLHGAAHAPVEAAERLMELADLAESRLAGTARALWALTRHGELSAQDATTATRMERLAARDRVSEGMIQLAEEEIESGDSVTKLAAERRLAGLLRDRPDHRVRALSLYTQALARDPSDTAAADGVLRLLRLSGDRLALKAALIDRAGAQSSRAERIELRLEFASECVALGDPDGACRAALDVLEDSSRHSLARARLQVLAPLLREPLLRLRTLRKLAESAPDAKAKSCALAQLAWEERSSTLRLDCALEALELDREQARAAGAVAHFLSDLSPGRILPLAELLLAVLGDPPALRLRLASMARAAGDHALEEELLGGVMRLGLAPPGAALARLEAARRAGKLSNVASLVEEATGADVTDPGLLTGIEAVVASLAEQGDYAGACAVALRTADRLGQRGARLLPLALELAEQAQSTALRIAANERLVGRGQGEARVEALRRVAQLQRESGNHAGEVRALLRLLPRNPGDAAALTRLTTLYGEAGAQSRLGAVLALRLDGATDEQERRELLLDLAELAAQDPDKSEQAEDYLARARELGAPDVAAAAPADLASAGDPREAAERLAKRAEGQPDEQAEALWRRAVLVAEREAQDPSLALRLAEDGLAHVPSSSDLLVLFERIALDLADVAAAKRIYNRLGERAMGRHGRRALAYRQARWLERAGAGSEALAAYLEAFRLSPGDGVVFRGLERLATARDDPAPLAEALSALADRCRDVERHIELSTRSARLSADGLGDPGRAFERLHLSWLRTGSAGLVPSLRDLARRLLATDEAAAAAARAHLITGLRKRVDQSWDDADKVRSLVELASIAGDDGSQTDLALRTAHEAVALARESEEVDEELRTLAEMDLARRTPAEVAPPAEVDPPADVDTPADGEVVEAPSLSPASTEGGPVASSSLWAMDRDAIPGETANRPRLVETPGSNLRSGASLPSSNGWFSAPAPAQARAPSPPTPSPSRAAGGEHAGLFELVAECRAHPSRVEALQRLHELAGDLGRTALHHVTQEVLSLLRSDMAAPSLAAAHRVADQLVDPLALVTEQEEIHGRLLRALWEGALPLFRRPLRSFGVLGTQKVSALAARPLGEAFADGLRLLGPLEVTLYARPSSRREILIAPTHPPAVLVADTLEDDLEPLRFRLGVALQASRPSAVVLASCPADTGRMILEAVHAAFGPADGRGETARDAASLAADLWRTVPSRQQASLRRAVAALGAPPDYELAQRQILARGARAGLLLTGSLRTSLGALTLVDDDLAGMSLTDRASYVELVTRSSAAQALVGMALSDRWLVALEQTLQS